MYIAPNTTIKLYTFVPLDNSYKNTLWFDDINAQNNYFHGDTGILRKAYTENSYQRVHKNKIRINESADFLYCCSYLAFQNSNYGNKWFYAFVTAVEYVNNAVCEIEYEIDVMQTYLFDVSLKECFVEREHASMDAIGFNIVPEPVQLGDYVQQGEATPMFKESTMAETSIIVATSEEYVGSDTPHVFTEDDWQPADGQMFTGVYQGLKFYAFTGVDQVANTNEFLKYRTRYNKQDTIVSVFMSPAPITALFLSGGESNYSDKHLQNMVGTDFDGYVPKNKKLFTYPYNLLYATTGDGKSMQYRFEWFENPYDISFKREGQLSCTPSFGILPLGYKAGRYGEGYAPIPNQYGDIDLLLTCDNFPTCSYTIDSFRAWLAQNQFNIAGNMLGGVANAVTSGVIGSPEGAVSAGVGATAGVLKDFANASLLPDVNRGNTCNNNLLFSMGVQDIYVCRKSIQGGFAHLIDDFFTKYGYAMQYVKVPNRNVRKEFTYTKTRGCVAVGICPADDTRKICDIYDNGITFWKNAENVGNYSVDNGTLI